MTPTAPSTLLPESEWRARLDAHRERVEPEAIAFQKRRARGETHPVWDFLFVYYGTNRRTLTDWRPPVGAVLGGDASCVFGETFPKRETPEGLMLDIGLLDAGDLRRLRFVDSLLAAAQQRRAFFKCFGLHEWAMVYRASQPRHAVPLRMSADELAAFVESQTICCGHFDAYRFFTAAAHPLNTLRPGKDDRHAFEQFGCLHVTMDLYKWCYKLCPWVSSELTAEAFFLAKTARELDMRASPYDLRAYGFEPVKIETAEGRGDYARRQAALSEQARALAEGLRAEIALLLKLVPKSDTNPRTGQCGEI
ncbi:MAG: 3-methyladenine DNA glycosylase [Opitutales bacterium]